ncbi:ExeM/NucH family extracellular endonuclease [Massilia soli]|uniref:ExeM/NucH family extracellular endonuclease n=1 Tax=Massilia soli TaxID=2792854 RepID=A0ABS7SKY1_9BURK|nr:ExeM/NucH family extracellular endonuclease [Massilia soli]MBZ2206842.1 ExeM/NucH family extracellular endonuclease [Massilia soli]
MTKIHAPGRLTVLAALLAGMAAPAFGASDIVISQVYGGGGNNGSVYKYDFVELFNRGATAVSLDGMSIQYTSSNGPGATGTSNWGVAVLPAKTLQPGQFLLMQMAAGAGTQPNLPVTPDGNGSLNLSGTGGKILLSSGSAPLTGFQPTTSVLDLLGWGQTNGFEGAFAAGTSNATAIARINACTDTDNNAADFAVQAPAPRNTDTAATPCGGTPVFPIIASCPASLMVQQGVAGSAPLSASDEDGIVTAASITGGSVAGIALAGFSAAAGNGQASTVNLNVAANVAVGSYPVVVNFTNNQEQSKSCTINVSVQGLAAVTHTIPEIQGADAKSPYDNTVQTTEGVITHKVSTGFFIQDAAGDGLATTSDGIFVYMANTPVTASVGDLVRVTGTVTEFTPTGASRSYTELKDTSAILVRSSGHAVTPTNIDSLAALANVEGMLVNFTNTLTVNQTGFLGQRGELTLSVGRRETPTNRFRPNSPEALALAAENNANQIVLDDSIFVTPVVIPYIGEDSTVRAGDSVTGLTGVVDFGAIGGGGAAFKLQPTEAPMFSRTNPRTEAPVVAAGNVKVASANVLNYFTTFTNGSDVSGATNQGCKVGSTTRASNCRGADNLAEYVRQRDKIVHSLKAIDADVVGLMEIQNNDDVAVSYLVDALNQAVGFATYAYVPRPPALGTDAIRVAMIYKPAKVTLQGAALSDGDAVNNRPPMAQTFKAANGARFSVIVNHLKSKGCGGASGLNADLGDGQSCFNADRVEQAVRLRDVFIPQVVAASGDSDVLVIGDMNAHGFEDPIHELTKAGYVNQLERFVRPHGIPYSYVFGGQSAYLDHALASASLNGQVAGAVEWHNNADEPEVIDYNLDGKPQDLYVNNAYRASDHDPVVVSLALAPTYADATASFSRALSGPTYNRSTGKYAGKATFTNKTGATISGPFHVTFSGLAAGITLDNASGQHNGVPYITASAASVAPGATVTVSMTFTNPAKAAIGFSNAVYTGAF